MHYPHPVHLLPAYADLGYSAGQLPVSESIAARELSLPMFPELTGEQIEAVAEPVAGYARSTTESQMALSAAQ